MLEDQDQGISMVSSVRASCWLADCCLLVFSRAYRDRQTNRETERERENVSPVVSLFIRALIPSWVPQHHDLI